MNRLDPDKKYCKWCAYAIQRGYFKHVKCKELHECECKSHKEYPLYPTMHDVPSLRLLQ